MEHGRVSDWDAMEQLWNFVVGRSGTLDSGASSSSASGVGSSLPIEDLTEHPLLFTTAPFTPFTQRKEIVERWLESMGTPAISLASSPLLALSGCGRRNGLVVDVGAGVVSSAAIYDGFTLEHSTEQVELGGEDVTSRLQHLLRMSGYPLHTSGEREICREINESVGRVALCPSEEEAAVRLGRGPGTEECSYTLPDGRVIHVGAASFRASELFFRPSLIGAEYPGVHEIAAASVFRSDVSLRKELFASVVLAGGASLTRGFGQRLLQELQRLAPKDTKIRIMAPKNRDVVSWIGGSVVASLSDYRDKYITKAQWQEVGESILESK